MTRPSPTRVLRIAGRAFLALFAALCVLTFPAGAARAADDAAALRAKLGQVRAEMVKNSENIVKMKSELNDSARASPPRMPDVTKLQAYATATGERTDAYHAAPEYIRKLIDEFEADQKRNVVQAGVLAMGAGNPIARYKIEITRSTEFGKLLQREERETLAALALALPQEQRTQERMEHEAMMNDWLARLMRRTDEWTARAQELVASKQAENVRPPPTGDLRQTLDGHETEALQKCAEARAALQTALAYGVAAVDGEARVTAALATARSRADACKSDQDATAVEDLYQEARRLAATMQHDRDAAEQAHTAFLDAVLYPTARRFLAVENAQAYLKFRDRLAEVMRNIRDLLDRMTQLAPEGEALRQEVEASRLHYTTTFPGAQPRFESLLTRIDEQLGALALEMGRTDPSKSSLRSSLRACDDRMAQAASALNREQRIVDALTDCGNPAELDKLLNKVRDVLQGTLLELGGNQDLLALAARCRANATSSPASGIDTTPPGGVTPPQQKKVVALTVTASQSTIKVGESADFTATARYDDGSTADVTADTRFNWGNPLVGRSPGNYVVSGNYRGVIGGGVTVKVVAADSAADERPPPPPPPPVARCLSLRIVADQTEVRPGTTIGFRAIASYDDGTTRDVTGLALWQPGPDNRYTAPADLNLNQRIRITATFGSCTGSTDVTALAPQWTAPLSQASQTGARAEPAKPSDYTWYVLCPKDVLDGTMVYGEQPSLARHHIVAGPFEGPRTADWWIKSNCPRARCTADGACANDPAYSPLPAWSVVCDKGDRRIYKTREVSLARHWVLQERLLGEPDAELWIQRNCPSRLCGEGGVCAAADQYRTGGRWAVVCDRSHGGVGLTEYPNRGTQHVWVENLYAEIDARQWADRNCPSWRCDRDGKCLAGDRPLASTAGGLPTEVPLDTVLGLYGQREASRSIAVPSSGTSTGGLVSGPTGTTSRYGSDTLEGAMRDRASGLAGHGGGDGHGGSGSGSGTGTGTGTGTTAPGRCTRNTDCPAGQQCSAAGVCVAAPSSGSTTAPAPAAPVAPQKNWIVFHPCDAAGGWWCLLQMANTTEAELRKKHKTLTILGSYAAQNEALTATCGRIGDVFRGGQFAPGFGGALGMVGGVKLAVGSFVIWDGATSKYKCRDRYYP